MTNYNLLTTVQRCRQMDTFQDTILIYTPDVRTASFITGNLFCFVLFINSNTSTFLEGIDFFFFKIKEKKKKLWTSISLESTISLFLSQRKLNSWSFWLEKNSVRFPCRERPCLGEKSPVNVKSHKENNVLSGNLNQLSWGKNWKTYSIWHRNS